MRLRNKSSASSTPLEMADGLPSELHSIRSDASGRYDEPLDREFSFVIKLFRFRRQDRSPGMTWHERPETFLPLDGPVKMRMGTRQAEVGPGDILIVENLKSHMTIDYPWCDTRVAVVSFPPDLVYTRSSPSQDDLLRHARAPVARPTGAEGKWADLCGGNQPGRVLQPELI
jgi:mannose-6-phosphate isomerase-like protein (cupin superfamily)